MAPLNQFCLINGHIVTQIIKAQFIVGAVGDVAGIGSLPLGRGHTGDYQANRQTHIAVDLTHPLGVTLGKVLVDRNHVNTAASESI